METEVISEIFWLTHFLPFIHQNQLYQFVQRLQRLAYHVGNFQVFSGTQVFTGDCLLQKLIL